MVRKDGCAYFQPFPSNGKTELDPAAAMATTGQNYLRYDYGMKPEGSSYPHIQKTREIQSIDLGESVAVPV